MTKKQDAAALWDAFFKKPKSTDARNRLVEHYLPMVKHVAWKHFCRLPDTVELDDLISAGSIGLMDAIRAFKPELGFQFETYAPRRISGAVMDYVRDNDPAPRLARQRQKRVQRGRQDAEQLLGRTVNDSEVAARMGITPEEYGKLQAEASIPDTLSLQATILKHGRNRKEVHLMDMLENPTDAVPGMTVHRRDVLRTVTRGLSKPERLIIILYYFEEMTMKEIGKTLDLSESRVSQVHTAIVKRLRESLSDRRDEFFPDTK